ncbi:MAG: GatB/YqeY domain-containing protein [Euzebyales bacterium]|nr:GatB/YqeY domain-containing protein [Euzebyales bacterium]
MASSEQIETDLRTAMKARDPETVATLRMVLAAIKNARVSAGRSGDVSDAEMTDILAKQGKQRSEAAAAYRDGGRDELADKEERELAIIQRYLPAALDDDELAAIVDQAVAETGASGPGDLGAVMSAVMPKVKGRADGKRVNAMVRARLQG